MQFSYLTDLHCDKRIASIVYPDYTLKEPTDAINATLATINDNAFIDVPIELLSKFLQLITNFDIKRSIGVLLPCNLSLMSDKHAIENIKALKHQGINIALIDGVGGLDYRVIEIAKPRFILLAQTETNFEHLFQDRFFLATCRYFRELGVDVAINTFEQYDGNKMTTVGINYAVHHHNG